MTEVSTGGGSQEKMGREWRKQDKEGKKLNHCRRSPPHSLVPQETLDDNILPKTLSHLMVKELSLQGVWLAM